MRRRHRIVMLATLLALAPALSGCESFDMDKLDVFGLGEKKKLPGERKAVFPDGVPGVTQGIPQEYIAGNAPAADAAAAQPVEPNSKSAAVAPDEKPAPKPKPKRAPRPRVTVSVPAQNQPASSPQPAQQPAQQQQAPAPWPEPAQSSGGAPWPAAPAPGTFSR